MEILLRRLLGVYFVVSAVAFLPAAFFYFGVESTPGVPWWILPAIPLAQGIVFAKDNRTILVQFDVEKALAVYQIRDGKLADTGERLKLDAGPVSIRATPR